MLTEWVLSLENISPNVLIVRHFATGITPFVSNIATSIGGNAVLPMVGYHWDLCRGAWSIWQLGPNGCILGIPSVVARGWRCCTAVSHS